MLLTKLYFEIRSKERFIISYLWLVICNKLLTLYLVKFSLYILIKNKKNYSIISNLIILNIVFNISHSNNRGIHSLVYWWLIYCLNCGSRWYFFNNRVRVYYYKTFNPKSICHFGNVYSYLLIIEDNYRRFQNDICFGNI